MKGEYWIVNGFRSFTDFSWAAHSPDTGYVITVKNRGYRKKRTPEDSNADGLRLKTVYCIGRFVLL